MVNAIYTTEGKVQSASTSASSSSASTSESIPSNFTLNVVEVIPVFYGTQLKSVSSTLSLIDSINLPYDYYLTVITVETYGGSASFYIVYSNQFSFNNAQNPADIVSIANIPFSAPYLPRIPANTNITLFASTTGSGVQIHFAVSGFRA